MLAFVIESADGATQLRRAAKRVVTHRASQLIARALVLQQREHGGAEVRAAVRSGLGTADAAAGAIAELARAAGCKETSGARLYREVEASGVGARQRQTQRHQEQQRP